MAELPTARPATLSESGRHSPAGADRVLMPGLRCRCRTDDRAEWGHHPWDGRAACNQTCTVCLQACGYRRIPRTTRIVGMFGIGAAWLREGVSVFYRILAARVSRTTRPRNSQWTKPPTAHGHGRGGDRPIPVQLASRLGSRPQRSQTALLSHDLDLLKSAHSRVVWSAAN